MDRDDYRILGTISKDREGCIAAKVGKWACIKVIFILFQSELESER